MLNIIQPAGHAVHKKGIEPDIEIDEPKTTIKDIYMVDQIKEDTLVKKFVKTNKKDSLDKIDLLIKELDEKKIPVNKRILKKLVFDEVHRNEAPPLVYLDFDIQLEKAVDVFNKNEYKTKKAKYYFDNDNKKEQNKSN